MINKLIYILNLIEMCIFCQIVEKKIPAQIVYEDENYIAFNDINPKAPIHILIIPKKHLESFHLVKEKQDKELVKGLFDIAWKIIEEKNLQGCQLHINSGSEHGQEVPHIHLHLLSKAKTNISW